MEDPPAEIQPDLNLLWHSKAGVPAAFATRVPKAVEPVNLHPPKMQAPGIGSTHPILPVPPMLPMMPPPLPSMPSTPMTPGMAHLPALAMQPAMPTNAPVGAFPAPLTAPTAPTAPRAPPPPAPPAPAAPAVAFSGALPRPKHGGHTLDAHLEVARLAQAWLDRGSRAEKDKSDKRRIKRNKAEIDPYLPPREPAQEDDPYSVMLAEAEAEDAAELPEMPPPTSISAHKRKASQTDALSLSPPGRPAKVAVIEAEAKAETVKSDSSEASDSEEEESEEEDAEDDDIEEVPAEVGDGEAARLELFKLGAKCCSVVAHFVGGQKASLPENRRLDIDQRVRLEHCRKHLQWAGDLATVWHLALSDLREKVAWTTLCTYFVSRKRVGLAELKGGVVYIVPPDDTFLSELGLPAAAETLAGSLLGLQVRTSELPTEESLQEEVGLNEKEVAKEASQLST
ncbi:unnamed protein product [Durusdinium trenchii]|uniref:Spen paralogue and orthologue SPOC C-terminal domain-containing protein n=1 Tax=Durusdinium trenchii TaxID=1381693 RepID=A0ABP0R4K2_9DINO